MPSATPASSAPSSPTCRCASSPANHDTSVVMIERNYSAFITDHSDAIARAALLDTVAPEAENVVPMPQRAAS